MSATGNLPTAGGTLKFTYTFTGSCEGQTVTSWRATGTTSSWFTTAWTSNEITVTAGAATENKEIWLLPTVNNVECTNNYIYVSQTGLVCNCNNFTFSSTGQTINEVGLNTPIKIGTVTRANDSCSFSDLSLVKGCTPSTVNFSVEFRDGANANQKDIWLTSFPANTGQDVIPCTVSVKHVNDTNACHTIAIVQNGREKCDCTNIDYSVRLLKTTLPPEGSNGVRMLIASGESACGYLDPLINAPEMIDEANGNLVVSTAETSTGRIQFTWSGKILPLQSGVPEIPAAIKFNLLDKYGDVIAKDCEASEMLIQGTSIYCSCTDCMYIPHFQTDDLWIYSTGTRAYTFVIGGWAVGGAAGNSLNFNGSCSRATCNAFRVTTNKPNAFYNVTTDRGVYTLGDWWTPQDYWDNMEFNFQNRLDEYINPGDVITITFEHVVDAVVEDGELKRGYPCNDTTTYTFTATGCSCDFFSQTSDSYRWLTDYGSTINILGGQSMTLDARSYLMDCSYDDGFTIQAMNDTSRGCGMVITYNPDYPTMFTVTAPNVNNTDCQVPIGVYYNGQFCGWLGYYKFNVKTSCEQCQRDFVNRISIKSYQTYDCDSYNGVEFQPYTYSGLCAYVRVEIVNNPTNKFTVRSGWRGDWLNYSKGTSTPDTGDVVTIRVYPVTSSAGTRIFDESCYVEDDLTVYCESHTPTCTCDTEALHFTATTGVESVTYHPGDVINLGSFAEPEAECLSFMAVTGNEHATITYSGSQGNVTVTISSSLSADAEVAIDVYNKYTSEGGYISKCQPGQILRLTVDVD